MSRPAGASGGAPWLLAYRGPRRRRSCRRCQARARVVGSWDDERVARELESWFASRAFERWPTYRTFVADGRKRLYSAVLERGGPQRWAAELGVPCLPHRSGGGLSSDEVHDALRRLPRAHRPARFPTLAWLKRYGPPGLAAAVVRTGGAAYWAGVLHMPPAAPARWSDELIEAELRRVCAGAPRWSSRAEFEARGAIGVLRAVYTGRGSYWWAQRLGLSTQGLALGEVTRAIASRRGKRRSGGGPTRRVCPRTPWAGRCRRRGAS